MTLNMPLIRYFGLTFGEFLHCSLFKVGCAAQSCMTSTHKLFKRDLFNLRKKKVEKKYLLGGGPEIFGV